MSSDDVDKEATEAGLPEESGDTDNIPAELREYFAAGYVDVTPGKDGGVLKLVKRAGYDTDCPVADDRVFVHYLATFASGGSAYDSSRERGEPFKFTIGKEEVIKGWDIAIPTMARGEIAEIRCRKDYAYAAKGAPPAVPPDADLVFEVEIMDFRGIDASEDNDGTLFKSRVVPGEEFGSPNEGSQCDIHITGKYKGRVFEGRDVSFLLGEGEEIGLVEGVEIGLRRFTKNERARLRVTASRAYGSEGRPEHDIPPDADLDYEILLKDFVRGKEFWDLDTEEKLQFSEVAKERGTQHFSAGKLKLAKFQYGRIVEYLQFSDNLEGDHGKERNRLVLAAHLNLALCHLKLENNAAAIESANKALEVDAKNEKALFRRGMANQGLKEYEEALADFKSVLEIDPNNKAARNQLAMTANKIKELREKEKQAYAGMFDKLAKMEAKEKVSVNKEPGAPSGGDSTEKSAEGGTDQIPSKTGDQVPPGSTNDLDSDSATDSVKVSNELNAAAST